MAKVKVDEATHKYLAKIGRKGGKSVTPAKLTAIGGNLLKAQMARRKYPKCPKYRSHRFNPKTGKCYGCKFQRPGTVKS